MGFKIMKVFELEKAMAERNLRLCSGISLMIMDHEGQKEGLGNIVRFLTTFFIRFGSLVKSLSSCKGIQFSVGLSDHIVVDRSLPTSWLLISDNK